MTQPKVSVIVPIYKVEKYLVQCIDSIVNQTLKDIEIILVDEGDMDACRFIIDHYEQTDPRVKTIHEKNGGYGASVNKGMDLATGEYIAIVESDDFIEPEMYQEMYACAKKLDADMVKTPYYEYFDEKDGKKNVKHVCSYADMVTKTTPTEKTFSILDYPSQMAVHASLWSGIYRRSWINDKNIRFIAGKGAGYVDVGFRIDTFMNTDKAAWLNKPYYNYRMTNMTSSTNTFKLAPMLQRWKEAHASFETRYPNTYEKVGAYLFLDEYLNTVGWLPIIDCTDEEWNVLKENLSHVSEDIISKSPVMNSEQKEMALRAKRSVSKEDFLHNRPINYPPKQRYAIKMFNVIPLATLLFKNGKTWLKLFGIIPLLKIISGNRKIRVRLFDKIPFLKIVKR